MPRNISAKHRIRTHNRLLLFKCQYPKCCNFIHHLGNQNRKYCYSHQNKFGSLSKRDYINIKSTQQKFGDVRVPKTL